MTDQTIVKILLLVGGTHHDSPEIREILTGFLGAPDNFEVTMSEDMGVLTRANLAGYDVVVNTTTDQEPTDGQHYALLDAVAGGKGLIAIHGGTATFWNSPAYFGMIGGKFVGKSAPPGRRGMHKFVVKIKTARQVEDHPITMGVEDYEVADELFVLEGDQTQWHVLARAEGHPIMYIKTFGRGRVFVNGLGHGAQQLSYPTSQTLILNAIEWVAGLR